MLKGYKVKTTKEMIEVMTAYDNGAEIEVNRGINGWEQVLEPTWSWCKFNYRIKEQKKTVTIEKWLYEYPPLPTQHGGYFVIEKQTPCTLGSGKKVKLLDTYEVEL